MIKSLGEPHGMPCPDRMLLDLDLPKVRGAEVLAEFRRSKLCGDTPAIVMSSSDSAADGARVELLGISHYFQKPSDLDAFMQLGELVARFVTVTP
jgi:CheY-like chemotaxis protein